MIAIFIIIDLVVWSGFVLDSYLVTRPPKKDPFVMPDKEAEHDLVDGLWPWEGDDGV